MTSVEFRGFIFYHQFILLKSILYITDIILFKKHFQALPAFQV